MWRKIRIDLGSRKKRLRVLILSSVHTLKQNSPPPSPKKKTFSCNERKKCPIFEEIDSDDDFHLGCRSVNAITNSPSQYYTLRDDRTSPTYDLPPA